MKRVINILIITVNIERGHQSTELCPLAFKTPAEAEHELLCEGYSKTNRAHEFEWIEGNIMKTALLRVTSIA